MKQLGIRPLVNYYNRLGKEESYHIIAGRLLQHISKIHNMSIREVAALCFTSEASISRLSRKAGYEGFNELREQAGKASKNYYMENRLLMPEILQGGDTIPAYLSSIRSLLDALEKALSAEQIANAAALLHEASRVFYFGAGDAFIRLEQDLCVSGKLVDVCQGVDLQGLSPKDWSADTLVVVENPGYPWLRFDELAHTAKKTGAKLLMITCSANRDLENESDVTIALSGTKSGQDEFLFQAVMNILSMEYRRRYMDRWNYE